MPITAFLALFFFVSETWFGPQFKAEHVFDSMLLLFIEYEVFIGTNFVDNSYHCKKRIYTVIYFVFNEKIS